MKKIPIISRVINFFKRRQNSSLLNLKYWILDALGIRKGIIGIIVNEESAIRILTVYACVRIISKTIASFYYLFIEDLKRERMGS